MLMVLQARKPHHLVMHLIGFWWGPHIASNHDTSRTIKSVYRSEAPVTPTCDNSQRKQLSQSCRAMTHSLSSPGERRQSVFQVFEHRFPVGSSLQHPHTLGTKSHLSVNGDNHTPLPRCCSPQSPSPLTLLSPALKMLRGTNSRCMQANAKVTAPGGNSACTGCSCVCVVDAESTVWIEFHNFS